MALSKSDKEYLRLAIREETTTIITPVRDLALRLEQTVHGTEGKGGIVDDVSQIKKRVWKLTAITNTATALLTYLTQKLWGHI